MLSFHSLKIVILLPFSLKNSVTFKTVVTESYLSFVLLFFVQFSRCDFRGQISDDRCQMYWPSIFCLFPVSGLNPEFKQATCLSEFNTQSLRGQISDDRCQICWPSIFCLFPDSGLNSILNHCLAGSDSCPLTPAVWFGGLKRTRTSDLTLIRRAL